MASDSDNQYAAELGAFDFYYNQMLTHLNARIIQGRFVSMALVSGSIGNRVGHELPNDHKMDTILNEIRSNIALNGPSVFGQLIKALHDEPQYKNLANDLNRKYTELKNKNSYNDRNAAREMSAQAMPDVSRISLSNQPPPAGGTAPQNPLSNTETASSHGRGILLQTAAALPPTIDDVARQMTNSAIIDQTATMDIVVKVVPKVLEHWMEIGYCLKVAEHDLRAIDGELHNDQRAACRKMLRKWLDTATAKAPKTWRTFVQALLDLNIDYSRVIAVLEKEPIQK